MSYSSLWEISKDFNGQRCSEYHNSFLFSPIVWEVLCDKYLHREFSMFRINGEYDVLNRELNNSRVTSDRVCWELSNQQIFWSKDKAVVAACIEKFLTENDKYGKFDGVSILKRDHIQDRFRQIAQDIREMESEYFVFKNSSVDDTVESWFYDYENDCPVPLNKDHAEFVVMKEGQIAYFVFAKELMEGKKNEDKN